MKKFLKKNKGEVVIESTIVVTIVVLFLLMMIYMGIMIYQRTLVSVIANQAAANIAQVYSNEVKDPFTGYIDASSLNNSGMITKMKDEAYRDVIEEKAQWFSQYRLRRFKMLNTGDPIVNVEIVAKPSELMKAQVVVTIEDQFVLPLAGFFDSDGEMKIKATGRADCFDLLDYKNTVDVLASPSSPDDGSIDKIDITENYIITFYKDKKSSEVYQTREVMQNTSIAVTQKFNPNKYKGFPATPIDPTGAHFHCWAMPNGEPFTENTTVVSNVDVYPVWRYKIDLDPNNGQVNPASIWVDKYEAVSNLPTPTKKDAIFDGWYTEDGTLFKNGSTVKSDLKLKARWKYNVTFVVDSKEVAKNTVIENNTIGSVFNPLLNPVKNGRTFYRWEDDSGNPINSNTKVTRPIKAHAVWNYVITFKANGGIVQGKDFSVYQVNPNSQFDFSNTAPTPIRLGCQFAGWYSGGTKYSGLMTVNSDLVLTAKWSCKVSFIDKNKTLKSITLEAGSKIGEQFPSLSKDGVHKGYSYTLVWTDYYGSVVTKDTTVSANLNVYVNWSHQHQYFQVSASANDAKWDGCGAKTVVSECGVCGGRTTNRTPGGAHNFSVACDQSGKNHTFPSNIQWSFCSAGGGNKYHCFGTYYHKLCSKCGMEDTTRAKRTFRYIDSKNKITYYTMARANIWCGVRGHDAVVDKGIAKKPCPAGAIDYIKVAKHQINNKVYDYTPTS